MGLIVSRPFLFTIGVYRWLTIRVTLPSASDRLLLNPVCRVDVLASTCIDHAQLRSFAISLCRYQALLTDCGKTEGTPKARVSSTKAFSAASHTVTPLSSWLPLPSRYRPRAKTPQCNRHRLGCPFLAPLQRRPPRHIDRSPYRRTLQGQARSR